ncbi:prophage endopeptidase tail family protein [Paenibacillus sp. M1]|uniref:Prophage endopeptidase tail family protein n=1 Tax=Paenibacillus haidiansis TaxID=1574488 RepID=A0ABU7VRI1_9BACL
MITILNASKQPVAVLDDYFDDEISEQINGAYTLNFSVYLDDDKSPYIQIGNFAEAEGQWFNIIHHRRTRAESGEVVIAVECEQVAYDLLFTIFEGGFIHTGSPAVLLNRALEGTGFTVGTVQPTGLISVDLKEGVSARAVILEIAAQCGGELKFDKYSISLLTRRGQDRGVQFRLGKNLRGIVKDVNGQSGVVQTAYEIDVVELNTLPEFEGLEYFELGDTADAIDEELGINEAQRIIQYAFSPKRRINSKVVIANYIDGIQDTIYRIQTTTVGKDKWMYGVKIGPDDGIVIERYDKLARSIWNADEFRMQKGNGNGSYSDALYFDPINEEYEFTGIVRAGQFIGGSIEIGSNFSVDEDGHMIAEGAEFSGDISASTITGTEIEGGEIYGSYIYGAEIEGGTVIGATVMTGDVGERRVEMRSGYADIGIFSGSGNDNVFSILDNDTTVELLFEKSGFITSASGAIYINAPNGVYVNDVLIG